jgi:hypothetical protein
MTRSHFLASKNQEFKNSGVMYASDALDAGHAISFEQETENSLSFVNGRVHPVQQIGVRLSECFRALTTAEPLKSVAMFSEALAFGTAIVAGHADLDLSSGPVQNGGGCQIPAFGFGLRLFPLAGANCQREESLESQPQTVPSVWRNLIVSGAFWRTCCLYNETLFGQAAQRRMQHPERVFIGRQINSHQLQSFSDLRYGYAMSRGESEHVQAQLGQRLRRFLIRVSQGHHRFNSLFDLDDALVDPLPLLDALLQFLLQALQRLTVRIKLNEHVSQYA